MNKAVIPLALALILGGVAAFLIKNAISRHTVPSQLPTNLVTVVVAKQNCEPGTELTPADVTTSKLPADLAPGHIYSDPNQLVGRVVTTALEKGQMVSETLLAPAGAGSGLQALIPSGYRAVTLEVNEFTGVGGMLAPGCHVDVVSILRNDKSHTSMARTVLQNIKVTAIGRTVTNTPPPEGAPLPPPSNNVTLLCTPKEAQTLELASVTGRPWLILRSSSEKAGQNTSLEGTTLAELLGDSSDNTTAEAANDANPGQVPVIPTINNGNAQPQDQGSNDNQPRMITRKVIVIQGGVESEWTYHIPAPVKAVTVGGEDLKDPLDPNNIGH